MTDKKHCDVCDATKPADDQPGVVGDWIIVGAFDGRDFQPRTMAGRHTKAGQLAGDYCGVACLAHKMSKVDPEATRALLEAT